MKLGIDVRWMVNNHRGMGRFATKLVSPVLGNVLGFAPKDFNGESQSYLINKIGNSFFPWWEQIVYPLEAKNHGVNILIFPYNTASVLNFSPLRKILVVHDLIFMKSVSELPLSSSLYQNLGRLYRRIFLPLAINRVHYIVAVSYFTKEQITQKLDVCPDKIVVIPNSIPDYWFENSISLDERDDYILTVTGDSPSKNLDRLLKAFSIYKDKSQSNIKLVVVGVHSDRHAYFYKKHAQLKIEKFVIFKPFLTDAEVMSLHKHASAFVFPSLYEGFGIPLLEAMSSKTPICCSNTTSLPEVTGGHALYFDPFDISDIAKKLDMILSLKNGNDLVEPAYVHAKQYSESNVEVKINKFWSERFDIN